MLRRSMDATRLGRPLQPLGPGRLLGLGVAVLVLGGLTAVASGAGSGAPQEAPGEALAGPIMASAVILVGLGEIAVLALVIWAVWPDSWRRRPRAEGRWWSVMVASVIQVATLFLAVWYLAQARRVFAKLPGAPGEGAGRGSHLSQSTFQAGGATWLTAAIVLTVLVLAGFAAYRLFRPARRSARHNLTEELAEAVDESLADLDQAGDARAAVIAAYARMERALAGGGLAREAHQTSLEYMRRVLLELAVAERPVSALTDLFQLAKFSRHEIDESMRRQAIGALTEIRADLLAAKAVAA
jgi:hypothetical protein